jgi:hypothetical protein
MSIRREEYPYNTEEQVIEYLRTALALVTELDPADDLREAVFTGALRLLSNKQVVLKETTLQPVDLSALKNGA